MDLLKYIFKRILVTIPIILLQITLVFFLAHIIPGNPFTWSLGPDQFLIDRYNAMVELYGVNDPILDQFLRYLRNLFTGNWGTSWGVSYGRPVWPLIRLSLMSSFRHLVFPVFCSIILSKWFGKRLATSKKKISITLSKIFFYITTSLSIIYIHPFYQLYVFRIGYLLDRGNWYLYTIGFKTLGMDDPIYLTGFRLLDCLLDGRWDLFIDTLIHSFPPFFLATSYLVAYLLRHVISSMKNEMNQDYIRTAQAKGLPMKKQLVHAYKNAKIPVITASTLLVRDLYLQFALIEYLFGYGGFFSLLINALSRNDYNVVVACLTFTLILTSSVHLILDISYGLIDPRISLTDDKSTDNASAGGKSIWFSIVRRIYARKNRSPNKFLQREDL